MIRSLRMLLALGLCICFADAADPPAPKDGKRALVCPQVLMMEWNGIFYYDTTTGGMMGDACGGAHQMVSTMGVHDTGCFADKTCRDPISSTGRDRKDRLPVISDYLKCKGKGVRRGNCDKYREGRVHLKDTRVSIDEDVDVQVDYKGKPRFFRLLVVAVEDTDGKPKTYCFGQETHPTDPDEKTRRVLLPDKGEFVDAKDGEYQQTIKFTLGKDTVETDKKDQKQVVLKVPLS